MSTPQEHIKKIQDKLQMLVDKYNGLQRENDRLKKSLQDLNAEADYLKEKNDQMSLQLNMMKVAETEDSKEAKLALEKKDQRIHQRNRQVYRTFR